MKEKHRRDYLVKLFVIVAFFGLLLAVFICIMIEPYIQNINLAKVFCAVFIISESMGILLMGALHCYLIKPIIQAIHHTRKISEHDGMTGLCNRVRFQKKIQEYNQCESIGVIFIDVNDLKRTNDFYGHEAGDELLCSVSKLIKNLNSNNLDSYRFGGDEFVVILSNSTEEQIEEKLKEFLDKIENISLKLSPIKVSVACGIAFTTSDINVNSLIKKRIIICIRTKWNKKIIVKTAIR